MMEKKIKIVFSSKATVDIEYNGKTARFYGELGMIGFRASANSMRWMSPKRDASVSALQRMELIQAVKMFCAKKKDRVILLMIKATKYEEYLIRANVRRGFL